MANDDSTIEIVFRDEGNLHSEENIHTAETKDDIRIPKSFIEDIKRYQREDIRTAETKDDISIATSNVDIHTAETQEDISTPIKRSDIHTAETQEDISRIESSRNRIPTAWFAPKFSDPSQDPRWKGYPKDRINPPSTVVGAENLAPASSTGNPPLPSVPPPPGKGPPTGKGPSGGKPSGGRPSFNLAKSMGKGSVYSLALAAVTESLTALAAAARRADQMLTDIAESRSAFSPDLMGATISRDLNLMFAQMDQARKIGSDLAPYIRARSELDMALIDLQTEIVKLISIFARVLNPESEEGKAVWSSLKGATIDTILGPWAHLLIKGLRKLLPKLNTWLDSQNANNLDMRGIHQDIADFVTGVPFVPPDPAFQRNWKNTHRKGPKF